jgi:hypothetical protein
MLPRLLRHWRIWVPLAVALAALGVAFVLLAPPVRPTVYDAIGQGMSIDEVHALMITQERFSLEHIFVNGDAYEAEEWESGYGDEIIVVYERPPDTREDYRVSKKELKRPFILLVPGAIREVAEKLGF